MESGRAGGHWWGTHQLEEGETLQLRIGPLRLAIQRLAQEWRLFHDQATGNGSDQPGWHWINDTFDPKHYTHSCRHLYRQTTTDLTLFPMTADRPVISRPTEPFYLPGKESVTLFVSSPLWLQIGVDHPASTLMELPMVRPSDTWFGASTREGELGYASQTQGRLHLEELPERPHRAVTPITIDNRADTTLLLERISLPVPYLSLFSDAEGHLWTQGVTLVRDQDGDMASLRIGKSAPGQAASATLITPARQHSDRHLLIRAFSALFK